MAKSDGGPAFPYQLEDRKGYTYEYSGMSLRDYAMVHVMSAMLGSKVTMAQLGSMVQQDPSFDVPNAIVKGATEIVDAFLESREW